MQIRNDGKRDSSVAELSSLRAIYLSTKTPVGLDVFQYGSKEVVHTSTKRGKSEFQTYKVSEGYLDSFLSEYLIGLLPLKVGYTAKLPFFSDAEKKVIQWEIKDTILDSFTSVNGKQYLAFVLTVDFGSSRGIYWVDKENGQLLKVLFQLPDDGVFIKYKV